MLKSHFLPCLLAVALSPLALISNGWAQTSTVQPVIAIVDIEQVLRRSQAFRNVSDQMRRYTEQFEAQRKQLQEQLVAQEQELARQRSALAQDVFNQRRQQFSNQMREADTALKTRIRSLAQANQRALGQIEQKIGEIVKQISGERGYNLVLVGKAVIIMDTAMDISGDVLAALDRTLPAVTVSLTQ